MDAQAPAASIPGATYRFQFNKDFGFSRAAELAPYLAQLGITHVYASPYLRARSGSLHGYDIIDHGSLNPEVGTEEEFRLYIQALEENGLEQILDIVPNHMCVESKDNVWWQDVLENGIGAAHASYFDINWSPLKRELTNKVLLPVLGGQFGKILENKELWLVYEEGSFCIYYYDHRLPLSPASFTVILSHRIEQLEQLPGESKNDVEELKSIITAFGHIPPDTETDESLVAERYREKEVTKRRLLKLYTDSPEIRRFVDRNMELFNGAQGDPASFTLLERLLLQQSYRVAHWRVATEEINYRRFFDINTLGAIRVELRPVFDDVHRLVLDLIHTGRVTGFRVDHADGLYNPVKYFHQLQYACFRELVSGDVAASDEAALEEITREYQKLVESDPHYKPFYVIGEKILLKDETVPETWAIHGETGYSFINTLNHFSVDPGSRDTFDAFYRTFSGVDQSLPSILSQKKKLVMSSSMSSEINTLGAHLSEIAEMNRHTRDFTLNSLTKALVEVIAHFPVYRTYTNSLDTSEVDRRQVAKAVDRARRINRALDPSVFEFVGDILTLRFYEDMEDEHKFRWLDFVMRFQQITGPVMAKGMEDTTFYVYNRLISLNEVGGDPERFGLSLEEFHDRNARHAASNPGGMLASTTHDTKRSEDVRARINVLTEIPDDWTGAVSRWSRTNRRHKKIVDGEVVPNGNKEYHLYQTLVGAWPLSEDEAEFGSFSMRIREYMQKALREAKENTSWINPNGEYEQAVDSFVEAILSDRGFLDDMRAFQKITSLCGMYSSLSLTLLKLTCPGVPDTYQGSELWDLRLVDPDNRQPVDYVVRNGILREIRRREETKGLAEVSASLAENMEDGGVKLFLIHKALQFRLRNRQLFAGGTYDPIVTTGDMRDNVCAFLRTHDDREILTVAPRFFARLTGKGRRKPRGNAVWEESRLILPDRDGVRYRNVFTGEVHDVPQGGLLLSEVLRAFPVALLTREQGIRTFQ